jgi:glucosamine--fructose-6-phosphate aminotransferase (isomerizing)
VSTDLAAAHLADGGRGQLMAAEIAEQPRMLAQLLDTGLAGIREVAARIRETDPRFVLLAARGTSDHAALYAKYLIEVELGLPCGLASLSTMSGYAARPHLDDVLWVAISQSGGSPDLIESTRAARSGGALTVALTNAPDSPLAAEADLHVDIQAGPERSVAATKSYTAELLSLWLLVDAWKGRDAAGARTLPEAVDQVLGGVEVEGVSARYRFVERLVTVGRGYSYPTAREGALKLMETSYLAAHAFSGADLLHGPLAMIDNDRPVIVIAPRGVGGELLRPVLTRLQDNDADVCLVGDPALAAEYATTSCVPIPDIDEQLSPIVQIVPLQQLALRVAVARHLDPDQPRGLKKVTETR